MLLIPAIDLKDGHCVRLKQGDMDLATVFSEDPAEMALHWLQKGARRLHLVDLNGAFAGKPKNEPAIKSILQVVQEFAEANGIEEIPVQLGGGIRDLDTIERYLDDGISYIIVGLDAKDGKVATDGWSKMSGHEVIDLAQKFEGYGVESIIYTDIGRDGMMGGVNIEATVRLAQAVRIPIIASGGLHNLADVEALCAVQDEGIEGVICGRSIYEGTLDLESAQARADELTEGEEA